MLEKGNVFEGYQNEKVVVVEEALGQVFFIDCFFFGQCMKKADFLGRFVFTGYKTKLETIFDEANFEEATAVFLDSEEDAELCPHCGGEMAEVFYLDYSKCRACGYRDLSK